jgi:hypothetical protein
MVTEEHVGGRRWRSMERRHWQLKEAVDLVLRQFLTVDGGSAAGLAWLRGTRERCGVVGASALGAEECGDERAEMHSESRAELAAFSGYHEKRRDGFSHGPTTRWVMHGAAAACVVRGADVAAGRRHRHEVAAVVA